MFDTDETISDKAIETVTDVIPIILLSQHQLHPKWSNLQNMILKIYTKHITKQFINNNPKWHLLWCHCVRLLDIQIPKRATILNKFLSIVEPALRSGTPMRRAEGYYCWRILLEVLVKHDRLNSEKRLKLVCTPLKALQARTNDIALNKFHAWWYVLCNVNPTLTGYDAMVFDPFLQFCFGPFVDEPILTKFVELGKRFSDFLIMATVALGRLLGTIPSEWIDTVKIFNSDEIGINAEYFTKKSKLIINACGQATLLINGIKNDGCTIDCNKLIEKLWCNLFKNIEKSNKFEAFLLVLDNLKQLIQVDKVKFKHNLNLSYYFSFIFIYFLFFFYTLFNRKMHQQHLQQLL